MRFTLASLIVFAAAAQTACAQPATQQERPNVVLIVCDDLNDYIGHLGGHPQARTPNIDRLAASGVSFLRAYSNNPVCAPSRASFLTGIYGHHSGNIWWDPWHKNPVLANSHSLMEHFQANGYAVVGSGKLMHHHKSAVWDEYENTTDYGPFAHNGEKSGGHPSVPLPYRNIGAIDGSFAPLSDVPYNGEDGKGWVYGKRINKKLVPFHYNSETDRSLTPDELNARWAADRLKQFAEDDSDQPFFLAVGFIRPHLPLHAPKKNFDRFPLESVQVPTIKPDDAQDTHYLDLFYHDHQKGTRYYTTLRESYPTVEEGLRDFTQAYLACTNFVDDQVGVVLDSLEQNGLADNTIVVLTSDHGFNMGEKDYLFKNSPWEESTRVPLVIRAPGISQSGQLAEHPVSLIDIYPTLKDLCGLEGDTRKNDQGHALSGHSVRPFLADPKSNDWTGPEGAVSMIFVGRNPKPDLPDKEVWDPAKQHWSYRTQRWRYVWYNNGMVELYDHQSDPYEWTNLADDPAHADTRAELHQKLEDHLGFGLTRRGG